MIGHTDVSDVANPELFRPVADQFGGEIAVFMHPMPGIGGDCLSFTLPDKQLMSIEQLKEIIPADSDTVRSQHRCNDVMQLPGSEPWQYFPLLFNVLQNNIVVQKLFLLPPLMVIEGVTGFAKQCA